MLPVQQMRLENVQRVELLLEPPDGIRYGELGLCVGRVTYTAIRTAIANEGGLTVEEFTRLVWGVYRQPCATTVRTTIHRVNAVMELVKCPRRLALVRNAGRVVWAA